MSRNIKTKALAAVISCVLALGGCGGDTESGLESQVSAGVQEDDRTPVSTGAPVTTADLGGGASGAQPGGNTAKAGTSSRDFSHKGGPVMTMSMDTDRFEEYTPFLADWGVQPRDDAFGEFMEIYYIPGGDAGITAAGLAENYGGILSIEDHDTVTFGGRFTARHVTSMAEDLLQYDTYAISIEGGVIAFIVKTNTASSKTYGMELTELAKTFRYEFF